MKNLMLIVVDEGIPEYTIYQVADDHPFITTYGTVDEEDTPDLFEAYEALEEDDNAVIVGLPAHIDAVTIVYVY